MNNKNVMNEYQPRYNTEKAREFLAVAYCKDSQVFTSLTNEELDREVNDLLAGFDSRSKAFLMKQHGLDNGEAYARIMEAERKAMSKIHPPRRGNLETSL